MRTGLLRRPLPSTTTRRGAIQVLRSCRITTRLTGSIAVRRRLAASPPSQYTMRLLPAIYWRLSVVNALSVYPLGPPKTRP
jgi:hypothetical protein